MKSYLFDRFYLVVLVVQITASPHVPEVVYPRKSDSEFLTKSQTYDDESIRIPSIPSNSLENHYRQILEERRNKKLIESSAERKKRPPTRIHFAPIDGIEVFTADDYEGYNSPLNGVPNVPVDDDFDDISAEEKPLLPMTVRPSKGHSKRPWPWNTGTTTTKEPVKLESVKLTSSKPRNNGFRGKSLISEIEPDIKRTTMRESSTGLVEIVEMTTPTSTRTPATTESTLRSGFIKIKAHSIIAANGTRDEIKSNPQLFNTLQPLTRPSVEKRFPAKQWQIPPSLSGTTRSPTPLQFNRRYPPGFVNNFNTRQAVFEEVVGSYQEHQHQKFSSRPIVDSEVFESSPVPIGNNPPQQDERSSDFPSRNNYFHQRSGYYSRLQSPTPNLPSLSVDSVLNPFQTLTNVIAPGAGFFLPQVSRPPQQYQPPEINLPPPPKPKGINRSHGSSTKSISPKYRATFAKHNDVIQPIPLPASGIDENDMDLLQPVGPKQISPSGESVLIPTSAPIQPVKTTFGQQGGLPMVESSIDENRPQLDPNQKLALCCKKQQLTASCQNLCNFDTFTDKTLVSTFLTNQCPEPQRGLAFQCATTKVDHSACCQRNGLHLYAGGQCMPFCATHIPTPPNVFSYLPCLQVFDTIKNCYKEYQYTHPNIFGD